MARASLLVASLVAAVWLYAGDHPIGLDLEGGAIVQLDVAASSSPEDAREVVGRVVERLGLEGTATISGGSIMLWLPASGRSDIERFERSFSAEDFRLHPASLEVWPPPHVDLPAGLRRVTVGKTTAVEAESREELERDLTELEARTPLPRETVLGYEEQAERVLAYVLKDRPIAEGSDVIGARAELVEQSSPQLIFELSERAGAVFHDHTVRHRDRVIAVLVDDEIVVAPVVREPVPGGTIHLDLGTTGSASDAELLADRIRAASSGLQIANATIVPQHWAAALGRSVGVALGLAGAATWGFLLVRRRPRVWAVVAGASLTAGAVAEAYVVARGSTLTLATHLGVVPLALSAGAPALVSTLRLPSAAVVHRLIACWPGLFAFVGALVLGLAAASSPGFWRGVSATILIGIEAACVVALLGVLASAGPAAGETSARGTSP